MLSPMMQQYLKIKDEYPDTILLYRLGDFYEMFFDDAITVSRELELTLTGRDCGLPERAPMCGVPYHAVEGYIAKLLEKGFKVAICEQITKPGETKGLVERKIVREITSGTKIDSELLDEKTNNYIVSAYKQDGKVGISWLDISTGEFNNIQIDAQLALNINDILSRIEPSEIICNKDMFDFSAKLSLVKFGSICPFTLYNEKAYEFEKCSSLLKSYIKDWSSLRDKKLCISSAGALLEYIEKTQKRSLKHIFKTNLESLSDYLIIDSNARKTLELTQSSSDGKAKGSLLWFMDKTSTGMGARLLRNWIEKPSRNYGEINFRLNSVQFLVNNVQTLESVMNILKEIKDIERIAGRVSYGNASPRDLRTLGDSLLKTEELKTELNKCSDLYLKNITDKIYDLSQLYKLLISSIKATPAAVIREGGVIDDGFDTELDGYRNIQKNSKEILHNIEENERNNTGIKNLKISYNKVFGYFIEVSKSQLSSVPYRYIRRQTLANGERFITEELKEIESKILNAEEYAKNREQYIFDQILCKVNESVVDILESAKAVAEIDCLCSNAEISRKNGFVKPKIDKEVGHIKISEGLHCVVEQLLKSDSFVPNDTFLDGQDNRIMLITGPNMAGKSIYMKQVAIIVIMAHIGCFVPAKSAEICPIDRIFTRVGASDDMATGRSTFMVEMSEVTNILENATDNSLLLLDEIGRGTATFDGLSIAWSILEYLSKKLKAKTLFSTHYHELTELEGVYPGVKNYKMTVRELNGSIVFIRKLLRGSANKSFGIEVAGLAGLPNEVLIKAKELLKKLEKSDIAKKETENRNYQLSIYSDNKSNEVINIIRELKMEDMSLKKAFDILYDLKEKVDVQDENI